MTHLDPRLHFKLFGFVVLRGVFDPAPLARELDAELSDPESAAKAAAVGASEVRFRYVPMMTARSPASLALLDQLEPIASELLGGPVLPTRAKGVCYSGETPWHADSDRAVASLGCAAYLEPLRADNGALRVLPGSHDAAFGRALRETRAADLGPHDMPGYVVPTMPGDVVCFDEHLFHASSGGGVSRRQWRVDYVREPEGDASTREVRSYFGGIFAPDWDGGYDVDRHPSYGPDWLSSKRRAVAALAKLGIYELAAAHEAFARSRDVRTPPTRH